LWSFFASINHDSLSIAYLLLRADTSAGMTLQFTWLSTDRRR